MTKPIANVALLRATLLALVALVAIGACLNCTVAAASDACPNEAFRVGAGAGLPDCRAYEQATPVDKHGANALDGLNFGGASAAGNRITFSDAAGLPITGGSSSPTIYLASRGSGAWSSNGTLPFVESGERAEALGWDEEIERVVNSFASSSVSSSLIVADTAAGTFERLVPRAPNFLAEARLAGFASDAAHFTFENEAALTPEALGERNLYSVDHGTLSLVGLIPESPATSCNEAVAGQECVPAPEGSFAGPYNWLSGETAAGGASRRYYTQDTISRDGSKIFFTAAGSGQLYMREDGVRTVQISASQKVAPDPNGPKPAAFLAATPSGSKVFFLSCEELTEESPPSTPGGTCEGTGQDLYEFDLGKPEGERLTDLSASEEAGNYVSADVQGVLGTSEDGSDIYFVADGVLSSNESANHEHAEPGNCQIGIPLGTCNLYLAQPGSVTFIAPVNAASFDSLDWVPKLGSGELGRLEAKDSRVAADGTLLFSSTENLTGYDNTLPSGGNCNAPANDHCREYYRYNPADGALNCVSCEPSGARPMGSASLVSKAFFLEGTPKFAFLTRNLSADGNRVFFDSPDPLVAADTNGRSACSNFGNQGELTCQDVYEWEAVGTGSCGSAAVNGGCLYLLSTGTDSKISYFDDASASGNDVFFSTFQPLVGADVDELSDVYDARVGGGLASQYPAGRAEPCLGETCRGAATTAPNDPTAGSATFSGPGNGRRKKGKHCGRHRQKCAKHRKHHRRGKPRPGSNGKHKVGHKKNQHRGAHANLGGSK